LNPQDNNSVQLKTLVNNIGDIKSFERLLKGIMASPEINDIAIKNNARRVKNDLYE
jgi:hypothetical protein